MSAGRLTYANHRSSIRAHLIPITAAETMEQPTNLGRTDDGHHTLRIGPAAVTTMEYDPGASGPWATLWCHSLASRWGVREGLVLSRSGFQRPRCLTLVNNYRVTLGVRAVHIPGLHAAPTTACSACSRRHIRVISAFGLGIPYLLPTQRNLPSRQTLA